MHVPAAIEPLHWRNHYLIARLPVANKLGRLMDTLLKGQRPDNPTIMDEQAITVSVSPALVFMNGGFVNSRWPLSASLIQKLPVPFAPPGRSAPTGSPEARRL